VSNARHSHAMYPMAEIPAGEIILRDDRIKTAWTVKVNSFLLAPVPVTNALYSSILQKTVELSGHPQAPVVDVSWKDAVLFCNLFSRHSGLKECYSVSGNGENIVCNWEAVVIDFQQRRNGSMLVKLERVVTDTASLMR
jgi:hypothetical protein